MKPKDKEPINAPPATDQKTETNSDQDQKIPGPQPPVEIALDTIDIEAETHSRPVHEEVAEEYAILMNAGTIFPAVDVYEENGKYFLADGFHRVVAAQQAGKQTIAANVHRGGRLDALKAALSANETHGLRRTIEDKRFAVNKALKEFADLSDRAIAELCRVSPTFVGERRKLQAPTVHVDSSADVEPRERKGKDGKTRRHPRRSSAAADNEESDEARSVEASKPVDSPVAENGGGPSGTGLEKDSECETVVEESEAPKRWARGALAVVVWDHECTDDEPDKFYNRAAYPNCVLFHIWRSGEIHQRRTAMCGYDQLLTMLTHKNFVNKQGRLRVRSAARFVSARLAGDVPPSAILFDAVLRFPDLLAQIEKAWPAARKVLFGIPARRGWEVYIRRKRK